MKSIPIIIPEKNDDQPITLSLPKMTKLDKLAKTLIGSGIGLALAGIISSVLSDNDDEKNQQNSQTEEDDAQ